MQNHLNKSSEHVHIPVDRVTIEGELVLSADAGAVVVFPQGIGNEAVASANLRLAELLQAAKFATLSERAA